MRLIVIDKRFTDVSNVKAYVVRTGFAGSDLKSLADLIWEDLEAESMRTGRPLSNKKRYFVDGTEGNGVQLTLGTYKDFITICKFFDLLYKDRKYNSAALSLFNNPTMKCLGMQNIIRTNDGHLVFGVRSKLVQQAPGALCFSSGGVMPDYYEDVNNPDLYLSAEKQIKDELGIDVPRESLALYGITRDNYVSTNSALAFGTNVLLDSKEVVDAYMSAKDRYEHDRLVLVREDEFYDRLFRKELDLIGFCIGGMFLRDRLDSDKYKKELAELDFRIVES